LISFSFLESSLLTCHFSQFGADFMKYSIFLKVYYNEVSSVMFSLILFWGQGGGVAMFVLASCEETVLNAAYS